MSTGPTREIRAISCGRYGSQPAKHEPDRTDLPCTNWIVEWGSVIICPTCGVLPCSTRFPLRFEHTPRPSGPEVDRVVGAVMIAFFRQLFPLKSQKGYSNTSNA